MDRSKWEYKKLGEVCAPKTEILRANKLFGKDDVIEYIDISSIDNSSHCITQPTSFLFHDAPSRAQQKVKRGDILYSLVRPNLKNIAVVTSSNTEKYVASSGFCVLRSKDMDNRYLYYLVLSNPFTNYILGLVSGANYPAVREDDVKGFFFRCPPLSDQQRIVAELDCLNEMIAVKQEQLNEFDKLAQSIFYDMFGDPLENVYGWHCDILANLVSEDCSISYGIVQPGDDVEDGVPVVRPVDLTSNVVYRKGLKVVDKAISDSYKRTILKGNELLFCVRGTTGIMSFASEELKGCNVTRGITPLSFSEKVDKTYIYYLLATPYLQSIIAEKTNGIALKQINMRDVRQLPIILPPLSLQQQFADKISAIEAQKELVKQSIAETQALLDYTMDKYFG